ncbi:hypothetical protein DESC_260126 [Desulfosarcina cetonica]|nr:hypothetical protein DESC_260126 [Desulfosarcina cetonica]
MYGFRLPGKWRGQGTLEKLCLFIFEMGSHQDNRQKTLNMFYKIPSFIGKYRIFRQ